MFYKDDLALLVLIIIGTMLTVSPKGAQARTGLTGQTLRVNASYYGEGDIFDGRQAADGSIFHKNAPTVAHRTLPLGTKVVIQNPENGKTVRATVTDRGPYVAGRQLDVSAGLARRLGFMKQGTAALVMLLAYVPDKSILHHRR
jgi:rare lipoprotein A (peptidoglycan hydrolase)